jgi:hypothetical protein
MNSRTGVTSSADADADADSSTGPGSFSWSEDSRWVLDVGKKYYRVGLTVCALFFILYSSLLILLLSKGH